MDKKIDKDTKLIITNNKQIIKKKLSRPKKIWTKEEKEEAQKQITLNQEHFVEVEKGIVKLLSFAEKEKLHKEKEILNIHSLLIENDSKIEEHTRANQKAIRENSLATFNHITDRTIHVTQEDKNNIQATIEHTLEPHVKQYDIDEITEAVNSNTEHSHNKDVHFDDKEQKDNVINLLTNPASYIISEGGGGGAAHNFHPDLQGGLGKGSLAGEFYHLTSSQYTTLTDGSNADSLHAHSHSLLENLDSDDHLQYLNLNGRDPSGAGQIINDTITANDFIIPAMSIAGSTYSSLNDAFNMTTSAGRLTGGELVDNPSAGTVIVSAGTGIFRIADDDISQVKFGDWSESDAIEVPINSIMYFGIDYNDGSPTVITNTDDGFDLDTQFPLGSCINQNGEIYILNNPWWVGDGLTNIIERFESLGHLKRDEELGGLILGTTGTRYVTMTAGTLWGRLTEHILPAFDSSNADEYFDMYYRDGLGGTWSEVKLSQYDITQYDLNGVLTTINNNQYAVIWVFANASSNSLKPSLIYPQKTYPSSAAAEAEEIPNTIPAIWYQQGIIIGRIIIKEGQDAPVEVQSAFTQTFTAAQAADHGNLSGLEDDDHKGYILADGTRAFTGNVSLDTFDLTTTGDITAGNLNIANWDTAYTHSTDNSQAHSDYITNNADDVMSGKLTFTKTLSATANNHLAISGVISPSSAGQSFSNISFTGSVIGSVSDADITKITRVPSTLAVTRVGPVAYDGTITKAISFSSSIFGGGGFADITDAYAFYVENFASTGGNTWGFYNNTVANNSMGLDNAKTYFGTAQDVSFYFDGADMIINSENVTAADELLFTNFTKYDFDATVNAADYSVGGVAGATGTFTTTDSKTVTVTNGIITSIV